MRRIVERLRQLQPGLAATSSRFLSILMQVLLLRVCCCIAAAPTCTFFLFFWQIQSLGNKVAAKVSTLLPLPLLTCLFNCFTALLLCFLRVLMAGHAAAASRKLPLYSLRCCIPPPCFFFLKRDCFTCCLTYCVFADWLSAAASRVRYILLRCSFFLIALLLYLLLWVLRGFFFLPTGLAVAHPPCLPSYLSLYNLRAKLSNYSIISELSYYLTTL